MTASALLPLNFILGVIVLWLALGILGLAFQRNLRAIGGVLFPVGAVGALGLLIAAAGALDQPATHLVLPLGLPDLPFHLRLDSLSAFFLMLLGTGSVGVSLFSAGYFRPSGGTAPGLVCLQYHVFLASMALVLLADDAYFFMVSWETMALSSYFLVTTEHRIAEIRRAGFLYLLIAHVGAIGILLCFGVLHGGEGAYAYSFAAMRAQEHSSAWASVAFCLALFGFGAKAGLVPLHVWLPEAHPAAPSPVSALMSGVMLKTAIYGLLRVAFDLIGVQLGWWGVLMLAVGLASAAFGVIFAAVQTDMKRLLAYSSIENIGIIVAGVGLALLFKSYGRELPAALALTAALYHSLNHACFKTLLFMVTGHVLHATGERNLGKLGGLIRRMPWVAGLGLVGTLGIAGVPPLNGFVSEWLLLQGFLLAPALPNPFLAMMTPVAAAALVMAAALSGYAMVKFYGIVFLGQPREARLEQAHDGGIWELVGLSWLAIACVGLGVLPTFVSPAFAPVTSALTGSALPTAQLWVLAPVDPDRASYSPLIFLLVIVAVITLIILAIRWLYPTRSRRGPAWDCGFVGQNARMQDTAEGFGQPIRRMFTPFFDYERHFPDPFDAHPRFDVRASDRFWRWLYAPVAKLVEQVSRLSSVLHHGRINL
ncbi:MAG TPA: hydrogenase 4 subunit B, partial [Burkholderiales bacterium]|nr:hydrogenase 4 subunit B [Burkholderiales bacterium]